VTIITIKGKENKSKEVEAEIFGPLGVHEAWHSFGGLTITHIPTGYRLPVRSDADKAVKACADELSRSFDWDFSDPGAARGMKEKVVSVLNDWGVYEYAD
jgi:hypothetical protein